MRNNFIIIIFALLVIEFFPYRNISSYGQALRIMPLGNSITFHHDTYSPPLQENWGIRISYRYKLYQLLTAAGYTFDFVGNRNAGYNYMPSEYCDNAGFPGITASQLVNLLQTSYNDFENMYEVNSPEEEGVHYLENNPTDIILLHIGTNDLSLYTVNQSVDNVEAVLDEIQAFEDANSVTIPVFVALIIDRVPTHSGTGLFNVLLGSLVNSRKSSGDVLELVNMYDGASIVYEIYDQYTQPDGDMVDTWHPWYSGYDKMAQKWLQELESFNYQAPVVDDIPDDTLYENESYMTINLNNYVFDPQEPDEDISWSYTPYPSTHFNISIANGIATISSKNPEWSGNETITFKAEDSGNGSTPLYDTDDVTIYYVSVNDPPVITGGGPLTVQEDSQKEISLDSIQVTDPDNTYPDDFTLYVQPGSNYTVFGNDIVKPASNFNGALTVPVYVNDGKDNSNTYNLTVNVTNVNDSPWINLPSQRTVNEDSPYSKTVTPGDIDTGDDLVLSDIEPFPNWLSLNSAIGLLNGIPTNEYVGENIVTIRVFDGTVNVDSTFIIEVININDLPIFTSFPEDTTIYTYSTFEYFITAIDIDPTNDFLTYEVVEKPGWLDYDAILRKLSGIPVKADSGIHAVEIRVFDGTGYSYQNFNLYVDLENYPPEITSTPNSETYEDSNYIYALKATDRNYDPLTYTGISIPYWCSFYPSGVLMGLPKNEDVGFYEVILSVDDGSNIVYDSFNLEVININDPPVILGITRPINTPIETPVEIKLQYLNVEDVDNTYPDDFTLKLQNGSNYTVIDNSVVPYTGFIGYLKVGIKVNDGLADSEKAEIDVGVGTTSIGDHLIKNSIVRMVYPNPAENYINFRFKDNHEQAIISFFDGSMKLIKKVIIPEETFEVKIDMYEFVSGIVFYKVDYQNKFFTGKIIIR
jgi:hypothetical protein